MTPSEGTGEGLCDMRGRRSMPIQKVLIPIFVEQKGIQVSTEAGLSRLGCSNFIDGYEMVPVQTESQMKGLWIDLWHIDYVLNIEDIEIPCAAVCSETTLMISPPQEYYTAHITVTDSEGTSEAGYKYKVLLTESTDGPYAYVYANTEQIIYRVGFPTGRYWHHDRGFEMT